MASLGSLVIDLLARTGKFETDIGRAAKIAERRSKQIQQNFDSLGRKIGAALGAYASVQTLQAIVRISDQYTQLRGRLALVTSGTEELGQVQQALFGIAQRTRTEMSGVADLYIKLAQTGKELGASQQELLKFTEGVGNALTVSGSNAQQASGALLQLSQALAGGTVRAEEFNSIIEGAPEILRTVATHMEGMDGSVAKLRKAVLDGKVSSEGFFRAFLKGADDLSKRAQSMPVTVGQAFIRMQNNINQAIGGTDMSPLVDAISDLSEAISDPTFQRNFASFVSGVVKLIGSSASAVSGTAGLATFIGEQLSAIFNGAASDDIVRLEDQLDKLRELRSMEWWDPNILNRGRVFGKDGLIEWYSDAELDKAIAEIQKKIDAFYKNRSAPPTIPTPDTGGGSTSGGPVVSPPPSEEFTKLADKLKEKIALYGKVGEAAEIAYKIEAGALDELSKAEQQQLLALAKRYDAVVKRVDAEKELAKEQKKAEEEIKKMTQSVEEQVATFGKGEAAVLSYRLAHGDLAKAFQQAGADDGLKQKISDLTAQMESMDAASISAARSMSDITEISEGLRLSIGSFVDEFENRFLDAADNSENLRQKLIDLTKQLELMTEASEKAGDAMEEFARQNREALDASLESFEHNFEDKFIKSGEALTVFVEEAARGTQDIIADSLINGFDRGAKGVLQSFGQLLVKITAEIVAADLTARLFKGLAGLGGGGAAGSFGALFGGGRAIGGPVLAGMTYRVNEREPEFFRPRVGGDIIPLSKMPNIGGGLVVNNNFTVRTESGDRVSRRTEQQIAAAASRAVAVASRRNN